MSPEYGMDEKSAEVLSQQYNIVAMVIFCISRFICTFILRYLNAGKLLMILAIFGGSREFTIPEDWDGKEIFINFDGVDSFFYLWINGQYVGFSKNSRNTASFNITKYLVKGF